MKSKQVWMKSKPFGFDEIKSVLISAKGDFICVVDLFRRKTDLVEKTVDSIRIYRFFWIIMYILIEFYIGDSNGTP